MSIVIDFTVPSTHLTIVSANVYESEAILGTYTLVYNTPITNTSTQLTYPLGSVSRWYKLSFIDSLGNEGCLSDPVTGTSPTVEGTYIPTAATASNRVNTLVDVMLNPKIERFRQLYVYRGEQFSFKRNPLKSTYCNWLTTAPIVAWRNSLQVDTELDAGTLDIVDNRRGLFQVTPQLDRGETLYVSYYFDYFPDWVLYGIFKEAIGLVNAYEPATMYNIDTYPQNWDGPLVEMAYVICIERLMLDTTLWAPRLIFANPDEVLSSLSTAVDGIRTRLDTTIPSMKRMPYVSAPTWAYYDAIRMGGSRASFHGESVGYGKTRGIRINRWFGR